MMMMMSEAPVQELCGVLSHLSTVVNPRSLLTLSGSTYLCLIYGSNRSILKL